MILLKLKISKELMDVKKFIYYSKVEKKRLLHILVFIVQKLL